MAVYTHVSEFELRSLLSQYDVGELVSYEGIAEGSENSNYFVHTDKSTIILTIYEKRVDEGDLPFFLGLMQHLSQKGIPCPLPVSRRDGAFICRLSGRPAALTTFIAGRTLRHPTAVHCHQAGKTLADIHVAAADFTLSRANALSIAGWDALWEASLNRANELEPGIVAEIEEEFTTLRGAWPSDLPLGIVHGDFFPDNVFFQDQSLVGVIDFYFSCREMWAYDIATCINAWCFDANASYDSANGRSFLDGYQSVRALSQAERAALPILARGSALRFLLTRLHDWFVLPDGPLVQKRDPREYLRRLRFHRQVRSSQEYGLSLEIA